MLTVYRRFFTSPRTARSFRRFRAMFIHLEVRHLRDQAAATAEVIVPHLLLSASALLYNTSPHLGFHGVSDRYTKTTSRSGEPSSDNIHTQCTLLRRVRSLELCAYLSYTAPGTTTHFFNSTFQLDFWTGWHSPNTNSSIRRGRLDSSTQLKDLIDESGESPTH